MTYANGDCISYEYDVLDRVEKLCYNGAVRYVVTYAKDGTVSQIDDLSENITYKYEYDRLGRLLTYHEIRNGQIITSFTNHYDSVGRNDKTSYKNVGYSERTYENTYNDRGELQKTKFAGNEVAVIKGVYHRDAYHRHYYNGQSRYGLGFAYKFFTNTAGEKKSANQITALRYSGTGIDLSYNYEYDALGNISNASGVMYAYDALNQLIRENNPDTGKTYVYSYDTAGNILSAKTYAYTTGALGTPLSEDVYAYTDVNWGDKLTSYNGVSFTYDVQGNPLTYYNGENYTFTWQNGRQLASTSKGTTNVTYKYNSDGIRYEKTVNGVVHKYYLNGSTITAETIVDNGNVTYIEYYCDVKKGENIPTILVNATLSAGFAASTSGDTVFSDKNIVKKSVKAIKDSLPGNNPNVKQAAKKFIKDTGKNVVSEIKTGIADGLFVNYVKKATQLFSGIYTNSKETYKSFC